MTHHQLRNRREKRFSLVELMVGLVIGLFATLVIMQVFSVFEGQKRSTSGTADAQTNGMIAMMQLQRHLKSAGYGMPMPMADLDNHILKCDSAVGKDAFPLLIDDGANGDGGDRIVSRYSATTGGGGVPIKVQNGKNSTVGEGMLVDNNIGCGNDQEVPDENDYNDKFQDLTDTTEEAETQALNSAMLIHAGQCEVVKIATQPKNTTENSTIRLESAPTLLAATWVVDGTPGAKTKLSCMGRLW